MAARNNSSHLDFTEREEGYRSEGTSWVDTQAKKKKKRKNHPRLLLFQTEWWESNGGGGVLGDNAREIEPGLC